MQKGVCLSQDKEIQRCRLLVDDHLTGPSLFADVSDTKRPPIPNFPAAAETMKKLGYRLLWVPM
ncbi:hypothetical protein TRIATDRAFT_254615 [Trichoderma atroviride IMI 206040]|uniref:Uncharacterized protein n=1 Tax=Hypocrea atroviridis (strain ATCC 20476 / IMI 206040) TaxID=452589 RepID=G9NGZ7_HYPAI|nr:uncharacterized protein TRIATDRAFT_254615 [Trichoderma atroviride IMI 206040]EHK49893.1 hypothetical protein TRIATDRAFT_254615 [Trichoderma atroviride IMI 206040]